MTDGKNGSQIPKPGSSGILVLKGGHVIDPKNNRNEVLDVLIENGRVAQIGTSSSSKSAGRVIDATGLYITPGIVDIHTHLYASTGLRDAWAGDMSVYPDGFSFRTGVTTMVDAGSSGWRNFENFKETVIDRARTRVFAFLNIASFGMISDMIEQDKRDFDSRIVSSMAGRYGETIVGVKTAHYQQPDWAFVEKAVEAGAQAGVPVMVDFGYFLKERPYWRLVTEKLRRGDITTHCYRAPVPYLDRNGKLLDYLRRARERGVIFDVGHGKESLVLRNAVPSVQQGFYPDSLSSDLHVASMNGPMMDMPTIMSKFLAMGMSLEDVILRATWNPARIIRHPELGHLSVGSPADLAGFKLLEGDYFFGDAAGGRIHGTRRLLCELTVRGGEIVWDWNMRCGVDYRSLPSGYGIRDGLDCLVYPGEN